jgi:phage/plasmid-associated DNA primase
MKVQEEYNKRRLHQILKTRSHEIPEDKWKMIKVLSNKKSNSYIVEYKREKYEGKWIGRATPKQSSLHFLPRDVRNALGEGIYVDVDMVNSNFQIMECLCEKHGIDHRLLKEFNKNRDNVFSDMIKQGITRDQCKELFIKIPNGGSIKTWMTKYKISHVPAFVEDFAKQMIAIRDYLLSLPENEVYVNFGKKRQKEKNNATWNNWKGSAISFLIQDIEYIILECFVKRAKSHHKIKPGVLMHDGCMFFYETDIIPDTILRDLERHVMDKLNYRIKLKCKPLEYNDIILGKDEMYDDIGPSVSEVNSNTTTTTATKTCVTCFLQYAKQNRLCRDKQRVGKVYKIDQDVPYNCESIYNDNGTDNHMFQYLINEFQEWCQQFDQLDVIDNFLAKPVEVLNNMSRFFEYLDHVDFPRIVLDRHLYGFRNGVWNIKTMEFTQKSEVKPKTYVIKYFDVDFEESKETPLWDSVIKYQLDDYTSKIVQGLLGRLFFHVNEMDHFEIMPALQGPAGNGKSTLIETIKLMFRKGAVSTIDKNTSANFCLESKDKASCIIIPDAKFNLSSKLDQNLLQSMISGESVDIDCKNKQQYTVPNWMVPMFIAFNRSLGYNDDAGSFTRRIAIVPWMKIVPSDMKDLSLGKKIETNEVPYIFVKLIKSYHELLQITEGKKDFWQIAPECMVLKKEETKSESNLVSQFLAEGPDTNRYSVLFKKDAHTNLEDFKNVFKMYIKFKHGMKTYKWSSICDNATLETHGYEIKQLHLCRSCNSTSKKGCCPDYNTMNRYKKYVILNMELNENRKEDNDFD